ncbi:MAG: hypothetical protein HY888_12825 [Deltaproteobacteria bacterium]|nr:hypothetical protein [Deltaproteobacteria bacterium]
MKRILRDITQNAAPVMGIISLLALLAAPPAAWSNDLQPQDEQLRGDPAAAPEAGTVRQAAVYSGYRFVAPLDNPAAAAPYQRQKSGFGGGFSVGTIGAELKLSADGQFLHADDYNAGLFLDYAGYYSLKLDSSALWHNLERIPPATATAVSSNELDSGSRFGLRTVISRASNRIKLGNNPIHLNLNYWQITRSGTTQLRFSDFYFDANPNSVYTRPATVDNVTREGTFGFDTHAGPINAAYSFTIRDFSNQAPDSRDLFVARDALSAGNQAHDTVNDSRLTTHTIKLYSDLSGGLTASALYSLTRREASVDRGDARPGSNPADTLHSAAADLSYTPFRELTLVLKYRRLQIDRESPRTIHSPYSLIPAAPSAVYTAMPGTLLVRPSSSSVKDTIVLSASYRPLPKTVYRFEYTAALESRNNLPDPQAPSDPGALRSDSRQTHSGKASFIWRPLNAVQLHTSYSYAASDNPAYPASFSERHSGQALLSYNSKGRWGITASYLGKFENGESSAMQSRLPRESISTSVNSTLWFSPLERMTVTASYSFMQSEIDQTNLFSSLVPAIPVQTIGNYRAAAHVYSIDTVIALARMIDLSLGFQQTFSDSRFSASDNSLNATLSSNGIGDKSRLSATETGITARSDWRVSRNLGCSLGYSFRMFDSGQPIFDGTVHETLLSLTGRW